MSNPGWPPQCLGSSHDRMLECKPLTSMQWTRTPGCTRLWPIRSPCIAELRSKTALTPSAKPPCSTNLSHTPYCTTQSSEHLTMASTATPHNSDRPTSDTTVPISELRNLVQHCVEAEGHSESDAEIITDVSTLTSREPQEHAQVLNHLLECRCCCGLSCAATTRAQSRYQQGQSPGSLTLAPWGSRRAAVP